MEEQEELKLVKMELEDSCWCSSALHWKGRLTGKKILGDEEAGAETEHGVAGKAGNVSV